MKCEAIRNHSITFLNEEFFAAKPPGLITPGDLFLIRVLRFNKSCYIIEATETITLHMADRTPAHQSSD